MKKEKVVIVKHTKIPDDLKCDFCGKKIADKETSNTYCITNVQSYGEPKIESLTTYYACSKCLQAYLNTYLKMNDEYFKMEIDIER